MKIPLFLMVLVALPFAAGAEDFRVVPELFDMMVQEGDSFQADLEIWNEAPVKRTFLITYTGELRNVAPLSVEIGPKSSKTLALTVDTVGLEPGLHTASLVVSNAGQKAEAKLRLTVQDKPAITPPSPTTIMIIVLIFILFVEAFYIFEIWRREG